MAQSAALATTRALVVPSFVASRPSTSLSSSHACIVSRRVSVPARKHMQRVAVQGARASTPTDIEKLIKEAQETCQENPDKECAAAWDEVEELSAEAAHAKARAKANPSSTDPLEKFCEDNPETDECRVYED